MNARFDNIIAGSDKKQAYRKLAVHIMQNEKRERCAEDINGSIHHRDSTGGDDKDIMLDCYQAGMALAIELLAEGKLNLQVVECDTEENG